MWKIYALLSAVFAALTAVLAKKGVGGIDSNLATAVRTVVILLITWGIVFATGAGNKIKDLTKENISFLILSGIAAGLSWLFYFAALKYGDVSKVAPVDKLSVVIAIILGFWLLKEPVSRYTVVGGALIFIGSLVILMER